ncbi:MAG: hypothetical protein IT445_08475 [Phycisphaeraceae bacterium]|nr:hypothetical protein [Phycisphaeraceae bacterium]
MDASIITIVAALRDEAAFVPGCMVTGMGPQRMCEALEHIDASRRNGRVILIGFAGGLDPRLASGDLLRIGRVLHEGDPPIELDESGGATLLTADTLVASPRQKSELRQTTGADAVDMESYFAARLMQQRGIPLTIFRGITDPSDAALPMQSTQWVKPDGSHDTAAVVGYLLTHPHHLPRLLRLGRSSRRAAEALGRAVAELGGTL